MPAIKPDWWDEGKAHLMRVDPVMAGLMDRFPDSMLVTRGAACETLMRSVMGQQISVKAAQAIWDRFAALVGDGIRPQDVLAQDENALRSAGLSGQKIRYIRGIAQGFVDGTVRPERWRDESDTTIIQELTALPGVGRWTAEMYLIFHLARPDVLPIDDIGLLKGGQLAYAQAVPVPLDAPLDDILKKELRRVPKVWQAAGRDLLIRSEAWRPYRSLATWYLWRSLDPHEIVY